MRMAELSTTSGIPVATIKYYLREKLLPAGESETANQARYGAVHLDRLRLIRALIEVGGLSVASARSVIDAIDSEASLPEVFEVAQCTVSAAVAPEDVDPVSLTDIDELLTGWRVSPTNPGRLSAARVLSVFRGLGQTDDRGWFARYAKAALLIAAADLDEIESREGRAAKAETVVVGTVLGDALISGLRRAAQEHVTSERYS
ncbi:MerR family transcriptional regulator [Glaciihabitans sp. INWT7]|nr:MerR family transcriptional regulator [Glaciihabitans sp. INWT7]